MPATCGVQHRPVAAPRATRSGRAFTLIELLLVIVMIGMLAALIWAGVAPASASPSRAGVSLARGWVHFPAVALGLGGLPGAQLLAGGPGRVAYDAEGTNFRVYASATTADDDNVKVSAHGELLEGDTAGRRSTVAGL